MVQVGQPVALFGFAHALAAVDAHVGVVSQVPALQSGQVGVGLQVEMRVVIDEGQHGEAGLGEQGVVFDAVDEAFFGQVQHLF